MVCRWLQVCLAAPAGAPGDVGVMGGVGVLGEMGVSGGLRKKKATLVACTRSTTQFSLKHHTCQ